VGLFWRFVFGGGIKKGHGRGFNTRRNVMNDLRSGGSSADFSLYYN
jgi:hypothetical protein